MRSVWKCASIALVGTVFAGACQLVSGLDGLDARSDAATEGASTTGSGASSASSGGSSSGSGGGGGGSGGAGGGGGVGGAGATGGAGGGAGGAGGVVVEGCNSLICPTVFIANTGVPVDMLAVDGTHIYWGFRGTPNVNPADGAIRRAKLSDPGSGVDVVHSAARVEDIYVSQAKNIIYWTEFYSTPSILYRGTDLSVPPVVVGYTGSHPFVSLTATPTDSYLLWAIFPDVNALVLQEAPPPTMAPASVSGAIATTPSELFVVDNLVYFHGANLIYCEALFGGGPCLQQSLSAVNPSGFGLEVKGDTVYWTNKQDDDENGAVWSTKIVGMNMPVLLVAGQKYPTYITTDALNYYWATNGAPSCGATLGAVHLKSPAVMDPANPGYVLAANLPCPSNFVQSGDAIYWGAGKTIYRMQKIAP